MHECSIAFCHQVFPYRCWVRVFRLGEPPVTDVVLTQQFYIFRHVLNPGMPLWVQHILIRFSMPSDLGMG